MTMTHSTAETIAIGTTIAATLHGGDIVTLQGDLGAGKTTLVKGIATALGITKDITSPTFTLMNVYDTKALNHKSIKAVVHIDTYRLKDAQELLNIGVEDYLGAPDTVCIIEWPEKVAGLLKDKKVKSIAIEHVAESERNIKIQ